MEEVQHLQLEGWMEQKHHSKNDSQPAIGKPFFGQQIDGNSSRSLSGDLHNEEEYRAAYAQTVKRGKEDKDEVGVMPEEMKAPDRDEGLLEAREEVRPLVIDPQVEGEGCVPGVADPSQIHKHQRPDQDRTAQHPGDRILLRDPISDSSRGASAPTIDELVALALRSLGQRHLSTPVAYAAPAGGECRWTGYVSSLKPTWLVVGADCLVVVVRGWVVVVVVGAVVVGGGPLDTTTFTLLPSGA